MKITKSATWSAVFFTIIVIFTPIFFVSAATFEPTDLNQTLEYVLTDNVISYSSYKGVEYPYSIEKASQLLSHNPSYGENDTYLGNVVDSFFNDNNVNVSVNIVHNATLDCMELNFSSAVAIPENCSLYTEQDEGGGITVVNDTYVDMVITRTNDRYIYYDFGAGNLDDYKLFGHIRLDYHDNAAWGGYWAMSNFVGNEQDHRDNTEDYTCFYFGGTFGKLGLREYEGGSFYSDGDTWDTPLDTFYWIRMEKVGVMLYFDVYSTEALRDAEGNGDMADLELTLHADHHFRYFYLGFAHDDSINVATNLELYDTTFITEGYDASGYFISNELVNGDRALIDFYNATIPAGTAITIAFSNDSSTWLNHNGVAGYEDLTAGFEAIDIRDLNTTALYYRLNMTSNGQDTPRWYQNRIATITAQPSAGARPEGWVFTIFVGGLGVAIIILGVKRRG